ncbi:MAG: MFS transporter [Promethearchaeota archaeon]
MSDTVEQRSSGYVWYLVIFMGLVGLLDQYLSQVEGPLIPFILEDFGITAVEFAIWQGIYGIIAFLVFFIAWISDAYGRRKGILILMLVLGIPTVLIVLTTEGNFHLFMLLYSIIILGTISNLWEIPIAEEAPPKKRGLYGSIAFMIGLIPIFAFVAGPIATSIGWRWAYGIMFFFMLGLCVMWYFMKEPKRWEIAHEERGSKILKIKEMFKTLNKQDWTYILMSTIVYSMWSMAFILAKSWGGYYYMNIQGLTEPQFRSILTIAALLTMVGAITSGILMDKLGRNGTLVIGCIGSVIGFMGLGLTAMPIFFWCIYLFMPMILGWIMVYFAEIFPTKIRSSAVGISATAVRVTYVVGPLIAALLLLTFPTMEGFWIVGGLFMIVPLVSLLIKPYETKGKVLEDVQEER